MGSKGPSAELVRSLRLHLSIRDQLGGSFHRWGAFTSLLVNRFVQRLNFAPRWARNVIDRAHAIVDTNPDDSDFDSDIEFAEHLNSRARPY